MSSFRQQIAEMRRKAAAKQAEYDDEYAAYEAKTALDYQIRNEFLQDAAAIPTPAEAYALWLGVYLEQGGRAKHVEDNFSTLPTIVNGVMGSDKNPLRFTKPENWQSGNYKGYDKLMPTAWTASPLSIPTGYGAMRMDLLVFEDLVNIDLSPTSDEDRSGWEYGHSTVFALKKGRGPFGLCASTIGFDHTRSYLDVEDILLNNSIESLANAYHRRLKAPRNAEVKVAPEHTLEPVRPGELTASPQTRNKRRKWFGR